MLTATISQTEPCTLNTALLTVVAMCLTEFSVHDKKITVAWAAPRVAHTTLATQIVGSKLFRLVGGTPSFTSRGFYKFCHVLKTELAK